MDKLYQDAYDNGVFVAACPMKEVTSMITEIDGGAAIALDSSNWYSEQEECYLMAHEMSHFHTGTYYNFSSPIQLKKKLEYRADTWMVYYLVPIEELHQAIHDGYTEVWELAEYFDVSEQVIIKADEIYRNKGLL